MRKGNLADIYSLTTMQEGILFHCIKEKEKGAYFEQFSCKLEGDLKVDKFIIAWKEVIKNNSALRTAFIWEGVKKPSQIILEECDCNFVQYDWSDISSSKFEEKYKNFLKEDKEFGFQLEEAPLMRFALIRVCESTYYFVWSFHHIIIDGWSVPLILKQMFENYNALIEGKNVPVCSVRNFKDYINWLRKQNKKQSSDYWKKYMRGFSEPIEISDNIGTSIDEGENREFVSYVPENLANKIEKSAMRLHVTAYQMYNMAYALLLGKLYGKKDVVFGTTVSGRPMELAGAEKMVGIFINTVPVRVKINDGSTVEECLKRMTMQQLERSKHEYLSIVEINGQSNVKKNLFNTILVFENYANNDIYNQQKLGFTIKDLKLDEKINYPLVWGIEPGEKIKLRTLYNDKCFDEELIKNLQIGFINILNDLSDKQKESVDSIELLSIAQKDNIFQTLGTSSWEDIEQTLELNTIDRLISIFAQDNDNFQCKNELNTFKKENLMNHVVVMDECMNILPKGFKGNICVVFTEEDIDFIDMKDRMLLKEYGCYGSKKLYLYVTGYVGTMMSDKILNIDMLRSSKVILQNRLFDLTFIEEQIKIKKLANDVKILYRRDKDGKEKFVVYYKDIYGKYNGILKSWTKLEHKDNYSDMLNELCEITDMAMDFCKNLFDFVNVSAIPYKEDGNVLFEKLLQLEVINENLLGRWEDVISVGKANEFNHVEIKKKRLESNKTHIADIVKDYKFIKNDNKVLHQKYKNTQQEIDEFNTEFKLSILEGNDLVIPSGITFAAGDILKRAVEKAPLQSIKFIGKYGSEEYHTYKEVYEISQNIYGGLVKLGIKPGDKLIFQMDNEFNYVATFWACLLGGFIAVPVSIASSYKEYNANTRKLYESWKALDKPLIIADKNLVEDIINLNSILQSEDSFIVEEVEQLMNSEGMESTYEAKPDDIAILFLTSGSTGMPKAVVQTHQNIVKRIVAWAEINHFDENEVTLNWLPLDHVVGIVMCHMQDIYLRCRSIIVKTSYILEEPVRWLKIISDNKVTMALAPNFAYNLINNLEDEVKKSQLDLSSLRFINNGGEAIVAKTAKRFMEMLEPYGLKQDIMMPGWGMSETCSGVLCSYNFASASKDDQYVCVGVPVPGFACRIVDKNNKVIAQNQEGSLQVKGTGVTPGYYMNTSVNDESFTEDGWFITGDLATISDDGVKIIGREKDVIIINGINYNNSEIEAMIDEIEGIEPSYTAAVTLKISGDDTEKMAVFFNPISMSGSGLKKIVKEMQRIVTGKIGVVVDFIIPLAKAEIPKTGIGKIQRVQLKNNLLSGKYDDLIKKIEMIQDKNIVQPWFSKRVWIEKALEKKSLSRDGRRFLIFSDENGLYKNIISKCGLAKEQVICVKPGSMFEILDDEVVKINTQNKDDYCNMFRYLKQKKFDITDILYLYPYNILEKVDVHSEDCVFGLLNLIQALKEVLGERDGMRLYIGSTDVYQCTFDNNEGYINATLSGFVRTLDTEVSWLNTQLVDLEGKNSTSDGKCISEEICQKEISSTEVCYRNGIRKVWKFKKVDLKEEEDSFDIIDNGLYVIAGGLGGIGTVISKYLLSKFDIDLVILGRSDLLGMNADSTRVKNYNAIRKISERVTYCCVDICNEVNLRKEIEKIESDMGRSINGIFHLAGEGNLKAHWNIMDNHWIDSESFNTFNLMYNAKVYGTNNLLKLLETRKDAVMIAFSSVNAALGGATFAAYSSANSYLNMACAYASRKRGLNAKCICWTMWENVGMSEGNPTFAVEASTGKGFQIITAEDGLRSLYAILNKKIDSVYVGIDDSNIHMHPLFDKDIYTLDIITLYMNQKAIVELSKNNNVVLDDYSTISEYQMFEVNEDGEIISEEIEKDVFIEPETETEKELVRIWREVLEVSKISINDNFFELGGHSLKVTQVVSRIKKKYDININANEIFHNPTISEEAKVIDEKLRAQDIITNEVEVEVLSEEEKRKGVPVSYGQQRLWFLKQYDQQSAFYNMQEVIRLEGKVNVDVLKRSMTEIINRHEALRTVFKTIDGNLLQVVQDIHEIDMPITDITYLQTELREQKLFELSDIETDKVFDLENGPLARFQLIKLDEEDYAIFLTIHHIITDGWSMGIFIKEFVELYKAYNDGKEVELSKIDWQYTDYSHWQQKWFSNEVKEKQLFYWKKKLKDITTLDIPSDYDRPQIQTFNGRKELFRLDENIFKKVIKVSESSGATTFMVLLAAVNVLFARYTNQYDIAIGTPIANRIRKEIENTIGFFANTLVLRNDVSGEITFMELIERVKQTSLEAYEAQDMPFEMLVDEMGLDRDLSRNPLFQVMFTLQNTELPDFTLPGLNVRRMDIDNKASMFDMWISMREVDSGFNVLCEYNTDIYSGQTIRRMMSHLERIIEILCTDPLTNIQQFSFMDKEETDYILYSLNDTNMKYEDNLFIHEMFEQQAKLNKELEAIRFEGLSLTYKQLNERVNQLANYLISQDVKIGQFIGIYMERSIEMIVAILGILKAGAAYVPIDPDYPQDRVNHMIEDSDTPFIITHDQVKDRLTNYEGIILTLGESDVTSVYSMENPNVHVKESDLAYMIYTSGSTGKPKGTMNMHKGIRNRIKWIQNEMHMQTDDRILQKTPFSFDVSCGEIFRPLTIGACLVIVKPNGHKDVDYLIDTIKEEKITVIHFVPSMLKLFMENPRSSQVRSLKRVCCSGEALQYSQVEQFKKQFDCELFNLFGPTEASVEVSFWNCRNKTDKKIVPIGRAVANTQLYVLDEYMNPTPLGVSGELYISGVNVASGYYKLQDLTNERFIDDPFSKVPGTKMYKTGDNVRILPDGNIEFIGRFDNQVKVRGLRIELGEIEQVIQQHPSVKDAVVIAKNDESGDGRIISYIIRDNDYQSKDEEDNDKKQVSQWKSVFDNAYDKQENNLESYNLNTASWNSSYTGEEIPKEEMAEWLEDSVGIIRKLKPKKVLEIGCGTGMILFNIAHICDEYVGTDLSQVGLDYIQDNLGELSNVRLYQRSADNLGELELEKFDMIVINSVIQYFPSGQYLYDVIQKLLSMLMPGGNIFIGDVRSLQLLESYHISVELFKAGDDVLITDMKAKIKESIEKENELLVDSKFFLGLKDSCDLVQNVAIIPKETQYGNEMSKFRYQVVIGIEKPYKLPEVNLIHWDTIVTEEVFLCLLNEGKEKAILITDIPLDKLKLENQAKRIMLEPGIENKTVGELKRELVDKISYVPNLSELLKMSIDMKYYVKPYWNRHNDDGKYEILLLDKKYYKDALTYVHYDIENRKNKIDLVGQFSDPMAWKYEHEYIPMLRDYIKQQLPDYMIPSLFMILDRFPLLPNGKLDKKALPSPKYSRNLLLSEYIDAENDTEKKIKKVWEDILNIGNIGVNDNFFDIGGHSLLLVQVHYKVREFFKTDITVVDMFKYPTIRSLSEYINNVDVNEKKNSELVQNMEVNKESMKKKKNRMKEIMTKKKNEGGII